MKYEWHLYPTHKNTILVEYLEDGIDGNSKYVNNVEEAYRWMLEVEGY